MSLLFRTSDSLQSSRASDRPLHRELVIELAQFAKINTRKGSLLFIADYILFWSAIAGVLLLPSLALKIVASIVAGVKMANLATLAHDAAHNSLTSSRRLNWLIAVLAFMPCLFNYRLWIYDHHHLHHPHTNGEHADSYRPLSKNEYDALTPFKRAYYRFTRSGNPLAFSVYYINERWWKVKVIPRSFLPETMRTSAWKHTAFVALYFTGFLTLLIVAPAFAPISSITAVSLCFVVPFLIFQGLLASALYINHTHPDIPWFNHETHPSSNLPAEALCLHLKFPKWFATLAHHFYEHPAHHVYPAIPCYELGKAQAHMNRLLGARALVVNFSFSSMAEILRTCKLYDYQNHCWLDFSGKPATQTARTILESKELHASTLNVV